jgi:hypothetical protein
MKQLAILPFVALLTACLSHPPPAPAPYRAVGINAGWTLLIDNRDITFIDGQNVVRQPRPASTAGAAGETYQTPRINVNVVRSPCSDGRTSIAYPERVQVTVDARRFEGCGGL